MLEGRELLVDDVNFRFDSRLNFFFRLAFKFIVIGEYEGVYKAKSPLVTDEIILSLKRRILENTCFDKNKWNEYYFNPLDYVFSPDSLWLDVVKMGIDNAIDFYIDTINDQGVWTPNFSWGVDTDISKQVTENWKGYITVKRAKTLLNFGRIEL